MDSKEAIKRLSNCLCSLYMSEAIDTAIDALEKQDKKKPKISRKDFYSFEGEYLLDFYCPCCNRRLISKDSTGWFSGKLESYCCECGQRIDWDEEKN